jgi:large subunit ribosomal protein L17
MAGGALKYRHLSRKSSHRQALLRNIVDSLIEHESVQTTWHKAKEAQRLAEKVITLGKKNTEASKRRATQIFYVRYTHSRSDGVGN